MLFGSNLNHTYFGKCIFDGGSLDNTNWSGAVFEWSSFQGTSLDNVEGFGECSWDQNNILKGGQRLYSIKLPDMNFDPKFKDEDLDEVIKPQKKKKGWCCCGGSDENEEDEEPEQNYKRVKEGFAMRYYLALKLDQVVLELHSDELTILRKICDRLFQSEQNVENYAENNEAWFMLWKLQYQVSSEVAQLVLKEIFNEEAVAALKQIRNLQFIGDPPEELTAAMKLLAQRLKTDYFQHVKDIRQEISYIEVLRENRTTIVTQAIALAVTATLSLTNLLWIWLEASGRLS